MNKEVYNYLKKKGFKLLYDEKFEKLDKKKIKYSFSETKTAPLSIDTIFQNYFQLELDEIDRKQRPSIYDPIIFKSEPRTDNKEIITDFGRLFFNLCLPQDFPFINQTINRKLATEIINTVFKFYSPEEFDKTTHCIQSKLTDIATIVSPTFEPTKFNLPPDIKEKIEHLRANMDSMEPQEIDKKLYEIYEDIEKYLTDKGLTFFDLIKSGTKGKKDDLIQLFISWGYGVDGEGNLTPPVKNSLLEGLTPEEMYYGANKAITAAYLKSVGSAQPGHIAKIMRAGLNDVKFDPELEDCGTKKYFELLVTDKNKPLIIGRYFLNEKTGKIEKLTEENISQYIGKKIKLRSPLYCKSEKICKTCAGYWLAEQLYDSELQNNSLWSRTYGIVYTKLINSYMKISHHRITAGEELDFEKELEKYYEK